MTSPAETLTPAGITWEKAMTEAGEILCALPKNPKQWDSFNIAAAQAWIAFAREVTMHARATQ